MVEQRRRRRVLLVTRNLPPLVGGMERLNWHLAQELSVDCEVCVISPVGTEALAPAGVSVLEVPLSPLGFFLFSAFFTAVRRAWLWQPDIVFAGSGLTAPIAYVAAKLSRAKLIVYAHGLDLVAPSRLYRAFWLPTIRRADRVLVNSRATWRLSESVGLQTTRLAIVHPGVEVAVERLDKARRLEIREELGIGRAPILLSVGRLSARKGLLEFVRYALPIISEAFSDVRLLIVGESPKNALLAKMHTREEIQSVADKLNLGHHLVFLGGVDNQRLAELFAVSNVHVFPVLDIPDDPEGFGMVAIEAAVHGLKTVAFASGGVPDAVEEGVSGHLIPAGDYAHFAQMVIRTLNRDDDESSRSATKTFAGKFSWHAFGRCIHDEIRSVMCQKP